MIDTVPLKTRLASLLARSSMYRKQALSELSEIEKISAQVAIAKGRLALSEEMGAVFDALQNRALLRSVGAFEKLLTAIMHDVVPDAQTSTIKLVPEYKAGTTWLDVMVAKPEGLEDLFDANGGALTNVASVGLRYAALSRTKNRPFMVLDEPDCWLKPSHVPEFVEVVAQVSNRFQTVYITHNPLPETQGRFTEVVIKRAPNGKIAATFDEATAPKWDDAAPGIRAIELQNFRSHEHTWVPLFPGMTVLGGDNNLGKSNAVIGALRAVCYGESPESVVQHGHKTAKVRLHLENSQVVEWVRQRDKSPAVSYALYKDGKLAEQGRAPKRGGVPDWVTDVLGIRLVDDIDIQLRKQKEPVFLLNDTASKRAQILSVGKESGHLVQIMQAYKRQNQADLDTARIGELDVMRLNYRQRILAPIADVNDDMVEASLEIDEWVEKAERCNRLEVLIESLRTHADLESKLGALQTTCQQLKLPAVPALPDTETLTELVSALQRGETLKALRVPVLPELPVIADTTALIELGMRLSRGAKIQGLTLPELPDLQGPSALETHSQALAVALATLSDGLKNTNELAGEDASLKTLEAAAQGELRALQEKLGHCPLCNAKFGETETHAHHEQTL